MASNNDELIILVTSPVLHVAGEELNGEVHLNFQGLQRTPIEEVHVKFRGSVFTRITRQQGQTSVTTRKRVELIRENVTLWRKGTAYPPPGEHILKLPFRFSLPADLLPSFHYHAFNRTGTVAYSIETVGVRSGLHINRRTLRPITILPHNLPGARLRDTFKLGWTGGTRDITGNKSIRRGIWGDYAQVCTTIRLPDLQEFPIFVPIPIELRIVTTSKPMHREDTPNNEAIFPAPPPTPSAIEFKLMRRVVLRTNSWSANGTESVSTLGGFGLSNPQVRAITIPHVDIMEKVWIPETRTGGKVDEKNQKGRWKQEVTFISTFEITCSPTFEFRTLSNSYWLALKVPFPGIGNDIKVELPIIIVSSMLPPGSRAAWDGPPPELDLPPAYLGATDWDHDEKTDD